MVASRLRSAAFRAGLAAALVLAFLAPLGRAALVEATSWIDAPLDGAVLPFAPYRVVAHSADQGGVAEVVLEVDGTQIERVIGDGASRLMTSYFRWNPSGLGVHLLTVRARNADGAWGAPASATVVISVAAQGPGPTAEPGASAAPSSTPGATLEPGQTATPAPPRTPGPTIGATPVPTPASTPCPMPTPKNVSPADLTTFDSDLEIVMPTYDWSWSGSSSCITGFVLMLHLDQQVAAYADAGWEREFQVADDTTSYQPPVILFPDESDSNGCGFYFWQVYAVDNVGEASEPSANWQIRVCPGG